MAKSPVEIFADGPASAPTQPNKEDIRDYLLWLQGQVDPSGSGTGVDFATDLTAHLNDKNNPHHVTADQLGLGDVHERIGVNVPLYGDRPGDSPNNFIDALTGGDPVSIGEISIGTRVSDENGRVRRITGAGIVATRAMYPLEPNKVYLVEFVVQRRVDTPDPSNDAVRCGLAWYNQGQGALTPPFSVVEDITTLVVGSGRKVVTAIVSRNAASGIDVPAPDGARYARPFLQTYGTLTQTDVEVTRWIDITNATSYSPDLTALEGRVSAIESLDLGPRVTTLEGQITAPNSIRLDAVGDVVATSIPISANVIELLGYSAAGDGGEAEYRRVATEPDHPAKIQSADGAWWEIVPGAVIYANSLGFSEGATGEANTAALQAAVDYARRQKETILTDKYVIATCDVGIRPGRYAVAGALALYTGVRIIGSGQSNTELKHTGGGSDFIVFTAVASEFLYNTWVLDLAIVGAGITTADTLSAVRASKDGAGLAIYGCGVARCLIANCYDGVGLRNSWTFEISECEMYNVGRNFIRGENITAAKIIGNRMDLAGEDGVYASFDTTTGNETIALYLQDNVIQSCQQRAIYGMDADHVMWDHNYVESNNQFGGFPAVEFASISGANAEMYSFVGGWVSPGSSPNSGQPAFLIAKARMVTSEGIYIRGNAFSVGWNLGSGVEGYKITGEYNGGPFISVGGNTTGIAISRVSLSISGVDSETQTVSTSGSSQPSSLSVRIQDLDCTSGAKTFTLQDAHLQLGRRFTVQKTDGGSNALIIAPQSGGAGTFINGANAPVNSTAAYARAEITCGLVAGTSTLCWFVKFT